MTRWMLLITFFTTGVFSQSAQEKEELLQLRRSVMATHTYPGPILEPHSPLEDLEDITAHFIGHQSQEAVSLTDYFRKK